MLPIGFNDYSQKRQELYGARSQVQSQFDDEMTQLSDDIELRCSAMGNAMLKIVFDLTAPNSPYDTEDKRLDADAQIDQIEQDLRNLIAAGSQKSQILVDQYAERREPVQAQINELDDNFLASLQVLSSPMAAQAPRPITYITVKCDAGYGNFLSICGSGPNMSWDPEKSQRLRCVGSDTWIFETHHNFESFNFKILLNGKQWEQSSDRYIHKNAPIELTPRFPQ